MRSFNPYSTHLSYFRDHWRFLTMPARIREGRPASTASLTGLVVQL